MRSGRGFESRHLHQIIWDSSVVQALLAQVPCGVDVFGYYEVVDIIPVIFQNSLHLIFDSSIIFRYVEVHRHLFDNSVPPYIE